MSGAMMSLNLQMVALILQFLDEEKYKGAMHMLEQESGVFFNMEYFEEKILNGEWEQAEKYMSGFTKFNDNRFSMKIMFEISKQKYLEALDRQDKARALDILVNDLHKFSHHDIELYKDITQLLTLPNIREHALLTQYGDTSIARRRLMSELKKLIKANCLLQDKLVFPTVGSSRLRILINQSINWQHLQCKDPAPSPKIESLFIDHFCPPPVIGSRALVPLPPVQLPAPLPSMQGAIVPNQAPGGDNNLNSSSLGYLKSDSEGTPNSSQQHKTPCLVDSLPRTVVYSQHHGSTVTSMEFHPCLHVLLLVGASTGEVTLWELEKRQRVASKLFEIWHLASRSSELQSALANEEGSISVSCVKWGPDGKYFGVAFNKNLIHLYAHSGVGNICRYLEFEAHDGGVNDLVFVYRNKELCIITCGDDKLIKVWNIAGQNLFTFEGHEAPVYSVCLHRNKEAQVIYSTSIDGKMKTWLYDNGGPQSGCDAPGNWCSRLLFSADGSRMFTCGTSKEGDTCLVQWSENEGRLNEAEQKRVYTGFGEKAEGVVHFDIVKNHFLAVGEDSQIKYWDMNHEDVLTSTDANGGLPSRPRLRCNKEGSLLVVTTADEGFMVLANGIGKLRICRSGDKEKLISTTVSAPNKSTGSSSAANVNETSGISDRVSPAMHTSSQNQTNTESRSFKKQKTMEEVINKSKPWHLAHIQEPVRCHIGVLPETDSSCKVVRLLYTSCGAAILALGSDGVQRLWRWYRTRHDRLPKASASVVPLLVKGYNGPLMANDVAGVNLEEAVPCIAITKNDCHVMSAYGGKIKLFDIVNLKLMTTFVELPNGVTAIAFDPRDNNFIAIGMPDCTIQFFLCTHSKVRAILKYHTKQITSLGFSMFLGVLVSADCNGQICVWNIDTWEMKQLVALYLLGPEKAPAGATQLQFHCNQVYLLVFHATQLVVYDASKMRLLQKWPPRGILYAPICHAAYSSNCKLVYTAFCDGNIGVFDADSLGLRYRIAPTAYLPESFLKRTFGFYTFVIAASPQLPNQFAVGLPDGTVEVVELSDSVGILSTSSRF